MSDSAIECRRKSGLAYSISAPPAHINESAAPLPPLLDNADITRVSETGVPPLDLMVSLKRAEPSIVKTRSGSVLSRGFILKTDHYPSG